MYIPLIASTSDCSDEYLFSNYRENIEWIRRNSCQKLKSNDSAISTTRYHSIPSFRNDGETGEEDIADLIVVDTECVALEEGIEILLDAIIHNKRRDVKTLLQLLRISPNRKDPSTGNIPLHLAIECSNSEMVEDLLEAGAEPNVRDKHGQTALHLATRKNMKESVGLLLRKKANPNVEDHVGHTPLWSAAWYGDTPDTLELLIQTGTGTINYECSDPDMPTALWSAAASPCLSVARSLLNAGADPGIRNKRGSTLLHKSGWDIAIHLAPELLAKNVDVYARDTEDKLPLHHAAAAGKTSIVKKLLERMGDGAVEERDGEGATALIRAAQKGSLPLIQCLNKEWEADYLAKDGRGNGALYYACANGHLLVATYLLGQGANINDSNKQGNTPLHTAARWGYTPIVGLLLQLGADTNAKSDQQVLGLKNQVLPADVARKAGYNSIAMMIENFEL